MQFAGKSRSLAAPVASAEAPHWPWPDVGRMSLSQISTIIGLRRCVLLLPSSAGGLWPCTATLPRTLMSSAWAKPL